VLVQENQIERKKLVMTNNLSQDKSYPEKKEVYFS
jgi:hypothetical protein